jgi:hypothetical protein
MKIGEVADSWKGEINKFIKRESDFEGSMVLEQIRFDSSGNLIFTIFGLDRVTPRTFESVSSKLPGCFFEHKLCEVNDPEKRYSTTKFFCSFIVVTSEAFRLSCGDGKAFVIPTMNSIMSQRNIRDNNSISLNILTIATFSFVVVAVLLYL